MWKEWGLLPEELAEGVVAILALRDLNHFRNGVVLLDALAEALHKFPCAGLAGSCDYSVKLHSLGEGQASVERHILVFLGVPLANLIHEVGLGLLESIAVRVSALAIGYEVLHLLGAYLLGAPHLTLVGYYAREDTIYLDVFSALILPAQELWHIALNH